MQRIHLNYDPFPPSIQYLFLYIKIFSGLFCVSFQGNFLGIRVSSSHFSLTPRELLSPHLSFKDGSFQTSFHVVSRSLQKEINLAFFMLLKIVDYGDNISG